MVQIIPITSDAHIAEICSVINMSFLSVANEFGYTKESVPTFPAFIGKEIIIKQINNGLILYGLLIDDSLAGSIGIKKEKANDLYKIERLAVLPKYRHRKYGKLLMDHVIKEIQKSGGRIAEVEIVNENIKLKKWYLNQGFKEVRIDKYEHLPFTVCVLDINI
jgi:ribosomal protein S18 acetylase RimI-like enzyme